MKKKTRRMFVSETVRVLDNVQLRNVDGGRSGPACSEVSHILTNCWPVLPTNDCVE